LQVNTIGIISFKQSFTHPQPTSFPLKNVDIIAPFWTDIDVNKSGNVLFQEVSDTDVLERITNDIITAYPSFTSFRAQWAFIVTWDNISIFNHKQEVIY